MYLLGDKDIVNLIEISHNRYINAACSNCMGEDGEGIWCALTLWEIKVSCMDSADSGMVILVLHRHVQWDCGGTDRALDPKN